MTTIDFHVHIFKDEIVNVNGIPTRAGKNEILAGMEEADIDISVLLVMAPKGDLPKTRVQNEWLSRICQEEPHFVGFGSVHPEDGEAALEEMERCVRELGFRGFKLHPSTQHFDCAVPGFVAVLQKAAELDAPVIVDSYDPFDDAQPSKLLKAILESSETKICLAHVGQWRYMDFAIYGAFRQRTGFDLNVYFDLSASCVEFYQTPFQEQFRWITEQLGADRLLFGSDFPLYLRKEGPEKPLCSPKYALEVIRNFGYPESWIPKIVGENAAKLLKL